MKLRTQNKFKILEKVFRDFAYEKNYKKIENWI